MSSKLPSASGSRGTTSDEETPSTTELLELLGDEYTRRVLQAVVEEPRSGTAVMDAADVSKATAYRRLEALEEVGLVVSETVFDPNGHHHERYRAIVEEIEFSFGDDGISADVAVDREDRQPAVPSVGAGTGDD